MIDFHASCPIIGLVEQVHWNNKCIRQLLLKRRDLLVKRQKEATRQPFWLILHYDEDFPIRRYGKNSHMSGSMMLTIFYFVDKFVDDFFVDKISTKKFPVLHT